MSEPRVVGDYVLGAVLGRGASSEVYAAEDRLVGDAVAVKLLHAHLATDARAVAAFVAEAERTRAIDHPNVVRVLAAGRADGALYLAMERLDGEDLGAHLARVGKLPEAEVRRLGAAIADGAQAAHDRGIVHRDLKPANVMLVGGAPKLVDFGIAKALEAGPLATAPRIGTIAYMAPEQIAGGALSPAVDVWALGAVLFECATGRLPFTDFANGRCPQLAEAAPPANVSPRLDAILAACLERDPARRPASMREVARMLREESSERITQLVGDQAASPARSIRSGIWLAIATLAVVGGLAALMMWPREDAPIPPAPADEEFAKEVAARPTTWPPIASLAQPTHAGDEPAGVADASPTSPPGVAPPTSAEAEPTTASPGVSTPSRFTVTIRSIPAGAAVLADGKRLGHTPMRVTLDGPTSLRLDLPGFRAKTVRAERDGEIRVELVPMPLKPKAAGETLD